MDETRAVKYLATDADGKDHLPYTDADGKPDHKLMGAAWAALHEGYRGEKYDGPDKKEAIKKLKAVYKSEKMDTPTEKKSLADLDERRAILGRMGDEVRAALTETRSLSDDQQGIFAMCRTAYAACYAGMTYFYSMPYDTMPDAVYSALYECYACCSLFMTILGRESAITPVAAELCVAGCRQCVSACQGTEDLILQACAGICGKAADAMYANGEEEEGRAARNGKDEVRSCKFELRSEGEGRKVIGYPIVFNALSEDLGGFRERILPSAVQFADDVRADFNHNPDYILGRSVAGTLSLTTDANGVRMEADAPETTWANDLLVSIRRGDIDQGSFAFRVLPGGQQIGEENGQTVRTLSKILVRRVSVVSDPAYTKTSVEVRSKASGQASDTAPLASGGGVDTDLLRRMTDMAEAD